MSRIHVVVTAAADVAGLLARATGLGEPHLVCLGEAPPATAAAGAATVTVLVPADGADARAEAYLPGLVTLLGDALAAAPTSGGDLVLVGSGASGWEISAQVATALGLGLVADATAVRRDGDGWQAERVVLGGAAVQTLAWRGPAVVTVAPASTATTTTPAEAGAPTVRTITVEPDTRVRTVARTRRVTDAVDLSAAARVVCVGMGVGSREELAVVEDLAAALDAEVACTRPVAEDREWLPTSRYIGISGAHVRPDLYLGVGVSGQVQHTVGMRESRVVVGIDTDPRSRLLAQSDLAVVGDEREIVPLLAAAVRARRAGAPA
jgi:electron transfer flavoprotein alpha subunit